MPEIFLSYNDQRDAIFFLGAGASYADGVPLQDELLEDIFDSSSEIYKSPLTKKIASFLQRYFNIEPQRSIYPSLESVFAFLEYFMERQESLGGEYTAEYLVELHESLVKLLHAVISEPVLDYDSVHVGTYEKFWTSIAKFNLNISVITTNYDTLLDEAFDFLYPKYALIDYCHPLMNYDHYDSIAPFNWWADPRGPVHVYNNEKPSPIKLIKIHGSLNWKYCNCCNQILLTPWDSRLDLNSGNFYNYDAETDSKLEILKCPIDDTDFRTLIVPPTHLKRLSNPVINHMSQEAAREIRNTKTIVFIGYSMPEADVHVKALLHKNVRPETRIIVVNRTIDEKLKSRFRPISKNIHFYEKEFRDFLENDAVCESILEQKTNNAWRMPDWEEVK